MTNQNESRFKIETNYAEGKITTYSVLLKENRTVIVYGLLFACAAQRLVEFLDTYENALRLQDKDVPNIYIGQS